MVPPVRPRPGRESDFEPHEEGFSLSRAFEAVGRIPTLYRAVFWLVVAAAAIFAALHSAQSFLSRDWAEKDRLAKARAEAAARAPAPEPVAEPMPDAAPWHPSPAGARRFWRNLLDEPGGGNIFRRAVRTARTLDGARTAARFALATRSEDAAKVYADLSALALSEGDPLEALRYSRISRSFPGELNSAQYNHALALRQVGRSAEAATELVRLLARNPGDADARRLLARILLGKGRGDCAFSLLEEVADQSDENAPFALEAACLAAENGERDEALRLFRLAAETCNLQATSRMWQRAEFAYLRQSDEGEAISSLLASRARAALRASLPLPDYTPQPRRSRP